MSGGRYSQAGAAESQPPDASHQSSTAGPTQSDWSDGQGPQMSPQALLLHGSKVSQVPQQTSSISAPEQGSQTS